MFVYGENVMNDNKIQSTATPVFVNHSAKSALPEAKQTLVKPVEEAKKTELVTDHETNAQPQEEQVAEAVGRIEEFVQSVQRNLEFSVDDDTGDSVVTVRDRVTDEVIRQIPSEDMLDIAKRLDEIGGVLFSVSA